MASNSHPSSILQLDDNCLYAIMSYLSLPDKLNLAFSDSRFEDCIKRFLRKDIFRISEIRTNFKETQIEAIFREYGHTIKRLYLDITNQKDIIYHQLATVHCSDLEELYCNCSRQSNVAGCSQLITNSSTLKRFKLLSWDFDENIQFDEISLELSKLPNLTSLTLDHSNITGKHLLVLTKLKDLSLRSCWDLDPGHFMEICKSNKLRKLDIVGCRKLNTVAFETLVETQIDLEQISVGNNYEASNFEIVALLKNLRKFSVSLSNFEDVVRYLAALSEHKGGSLEYLFADDLYQIRGFYFGYAPVEERFSEPIKRDILKFRKLKMLHLPCNTFVDDDFLEKLPKCCPELEILENNCPPMITERGVMQLLGESKYLAHIDFTGGVLDFRLYENIYRIIKDRNTVPLKLHTGYTEQIELFLDSMEYKERKQYVEVASESIRSIADSTQKKKRLRTTAANKCPNLIQTENSSLSTSQEISFLEFPDNVSELIVSYLAPVDKLKMLLIDNRYQALVTNSLREAQIDLNEFCRFFTFAETRRILSIYSRYLDKMYFIYKDGKKPFVYLALMESYKKDFIQVDVDSDPENFMEDNIFLFD
ncbi:uncharacterized protein LOC119650185 [Hermetia illucens]|uniref:uncharacterized protein LOC119650185 n=1 Tax=Hermetia illucens TaxID=343691 RepID=UPI0018CC4AB4|nr:uncharacterized protein LOC119650185 [Hermetia illucens]